MSMMEPVWSIHSTCGILSSGSPGSRPGEETTTVEHRVLESQMNQLRNKLKQILLTIVKIPIGP